MQQASVRLLEAIHQAQLSFIAEPDNRRAFDLLLDMLLELTESEYGFIGEIFDEPGVSPYLKIHAITDISWNDETRQLFELHSAGGLEFRNLKTLFGAVIVSGETVISNDPKSDSRSGGLPPGHPDLNRFLGIPFYYRESLIGMVGVANRESGYGNEIVDFLSPFLATCALLIHARKTRFAEEQRLENRRLQSLMHLAGNLAHDLNNSLTAILGVSEVEIQKRRSAGLGDDDSMGVIWAAAKQASNLSQQLLNYSGRSGLERSSLDLCNLLLEMVQVARPIANPAVEMNLDVPTQPVLVRGDSTALKQVFMNLLVNAIESTEASQAGKVDVHVTLADGNEVRIDIVDNGCGIESAELERICEPYYTTKRSGRGLGLASALGILNAHGGVLNIQSTVNSGTHVSVTLPVSDSFIEPSSGAENQTFDRSDEILIVDDDPRVLGVVVRIVTFLGFTAIPASSGQHAMACLEESEMVPQCAIVDLTMPEMDGLETLFALRRIHPELPVLLTTGYTTKSVPDEILAQKHTGFLKKPYSIDRLRETLLLILAN